MDIPMDKTKQARHPSEECFRGLIDESTVGFYRTTPDGSVIFANLAITEMLGHGSFDDITYRDLDREGLEGEFTRRDLRDRLEGEGKVSRLKCAWTRRDGSTIFVLESARVVRAEDGTALFHDGLVEDITEMKRAEAELFDSRQTLQMVLDHIPLGVFWKDREGKYLGGNQALLPQVGLGSIEEGMGKTDFEMPWKASAPSIAETDRWVMETETPRLNYEELLVLTDGSTRWMRKNKLPLRDREGGVIGVLGTAEDITPRKEEQEKLLLTQFSIDHAVDGVFWVSLDGRVSYANEAACRLLGYGRDELEGMAVYDIDCDITETGWPKQRDRMKEASSITFEARALAKDGRIIPVEMDVSYIHYKGRELFVAFMHDKTERKRVEEELRLTQFAVDHAADPVLRVNSEGRYCYVNDAACRALGYSREEFASMAVPDINCDITKAKWPALWARLKECGALTFESRIRTKDEKIIPVEVSLNFLSYAGKEHDVAFVRDMTERKHTQEKLQNSLDRLRALAIRLQHIREEERTQMAREIHDELGQALTAIKMDVCALARDWAAGRELPTPRMESLLGLVDETIRNVRRISTELRPGMLDDLGLAAAVRWSAEQFQTRTGIACQVHAPEGATPSDGQATTAIFRIFQETLTNVARHAGATRVEVRLAEEDDGLILEVHDDGRGIEPEKISGGQSLGILGMRERALAVGGELTIHGGPGKGTTVTVWVPDAWQEAGSVNP
jgi:PAS domain S-box-containing protein